MRHDRSLTVFTQPNFVADFLQAKCDFTWKTTVLRFELPFGGLGGMNDVHLRLIGKFVVDFLFVFPIHVFFHQLLRLKRPSYASAFARLPLCVVIVRCCWSSSLCVVVGHRRRRRCVSSSSLCVDVDVVLFLSSSLCVDVVVVVVELCRVCLVWYVFYFLSRLTCKYSLTLSRKSFFVTFGVWELYSVRRVLCIRVSLTSDE